MSAEPRRFAAFAALVGAVALMPLPALAAAATVAQNVNLRSGPGTAAAVVGQLQRGDAVDISKCQGLYCNVSFGGKSGWVSASFLTRDAISKPPATLILNTETATARAQAPRLPAPQVASAQPRLPSPAAGDFPPAYSAGPAPAYDASGAPPGLDAAGRPDFRQQPGYGGDPGYADNAPDPSYPGDTGSQVTLPPDNGRVIADTGVGLPPADIPGPPSPGAGYADGGRYADAPGADIGPLPSEDWNSGPDVRWRSYDNPRGRFAELGAPGRARVCFFGDGPDGGRFCLGAGQSRQQFGNWAYHISAIRNPGRLRVTICSTDDAHGCRVYDASGPVLLPGDASIASISVAPPAGY